MSYKYSFADNAEYSADDVNEITKRLVTSGVKDSFADGVAYNVSKFNEAGKQLYVAGVVPESCMTMKVTSAGDGKILINPGVAFFDDGSVIEIEDGGEELTYTKGAKNYVYLKNDLKSANVSFPCCSTEEPEGDYVMLAEIGSNGELTDKRTYARGKLPGYQSVAMGALFIDENVELSCIGSQIFEGEAEFDIGFNNFKYMFSVGERDTPTKYESLAVYNIESGNIVSFRRVNSSDCALSNTEMYTFFDQAKKRIYIRPSFADGKLKLYVNMYNPYDISSLIGTKVSVNLKLILI